MKVKGVIKLIEEEQTFGTKNFRKRNMVLTTLEEYPQMLLIEFVQDKCQVLDNFVIGQGVEIYINLRGREWINPEGVAKYFNSLQGWKIERSADSAPPAPPAHQAQASETHEGDEQSNEKPTDDLPF